MYLEIELYVKKLYHSIDIKEPSQLDVNHLSKLLKVNLMRHSEFSLSLALGNMIVLKSANSSTEWQTFGHEVCHLLRHVGNQASMHPLFVDLQEWQADYFAYHFCVPTFMLEKLELPNCLNAARSIVAETFNVEPAFAQKRLEMWRNKHISKGVI